MNIKYFDSKIEHIENQMTSFINDIINTNKEIVILCIGTDKATGDSLAPMVGTFLKEKGLENVIGDLENPVHAKNLHNVNLKNKFVIVIDACLGKNSNIGKIIIREGSIKPGIGVGKELPEYGNISITPIVNFSDFMPFMVLQNTRLNIVYKMAKIVANSIFDFISNRNKLMKIA